MSVCCNADNEPDFISLLSMTSCYSLTQIYSCFTQFAFLRKRMRHDTCAHTRWLSRDHPICVWIYNCPNQHLAKKPCRPSNLRNKKEMAPIQVVNEFYQVVNEFGITVMGLFHHSFSHSLWYGFIPLFVHLCR
jgi:hypothetical protein